MATTALVGAMIASAMSYSSAIPQGLTSVSVSHDSVALDWASVAGAPGYRVQYSTSPSMSGASYKRFSGSGGTLTGLAADTDYYVRVAVIDSTSGAKLSDYTQTPYPVVHTAEAPATGYRLPIPRGLALAGASTSTLTLKWDAVTGASKYRVQLSTSPSMSGATYHRFSEAGGTITGLRAGTGYHVRVAVIDPKSGAKLSDYTAKPYVNVSTPATANGYPLPIPAGLAATPSNDGVRLSWSAVSGAAMYRVQLSTSASMAGATYHRFTATTGTIDKLTPGRTYYARVAAIDPDSGAKLSDYTSEPYVTFTTSGENGYELPIPRDLEVADSTTKSALLTWSPVTGAAMYRVQLSTSASMAGATYHRFTGSSGTVTGLSKGATYYVRVAAIDPESGAKRSDYTGTPYVTFKTPLVDGATDLVIGSFNISGVQNDSKATIDQGGNIGTWIQRRDAVVQRIVDSKAVVVGLQEANQSPSWNDDKGVDRLPDGRTQYLDLLYKLDQRSSSWDLTNKYNYDCKKDTSSIDCVYVDRGASNATRILFDSSKVSMVTSDAVKYSAQSAGTTARYMAWAVFEIKATGKRFFFATTHLDPYSTSVRQAQWLQLAAEVRDRSNGLPAIVTGDFNASKFHAVAQAGLAAMRDIGVSDVLGQEYQVNPPRNTRAEKVTAGYLNSFNDYQRDLDANPSKCYCDAQHKIGNGIDYVFASDALRVKSFAINAQVDPATFAQIGVIPSDHHMLSATIVIP